MNTNTYLREPLNNSNKRNNSNRRNMWPKISIVMPSYNQVRFIEKSILSILNQDYSNYELIIIDGGSLDGTVEIIKKYNQHITYWVSESDRGQSDALNKGFELATGDIFGWLNSDDIYMPDTFINVVDVIRQHSTKKIVYGDWLEIDEYDRILAREYAFPINIGQTKYEGVSINAQSMFWHRSVHDRFGKFDASLHFTMDCEMVLSFALNEGCSAFMRIPHVLGCFRRYDGQKTEPANDERQLVEHRYLADKYYYMDKYTTFGKIKWAIFRVRRAYWYLRFAGFVFTFKKLMNKIKIN